jgi:predicted transcriptional regulator
MIRQTAIILSAYLAGNRLPETEFPDFIRSTYQALTATASPATVAETLRPQPAVSVKKSITADRIVCLECGQKFSILKQHLRTSHDATPDEYRAKWRLPSTYPMVAPNYSDQRSVLAIRSGLGQTQKKKIAKSHPRQTPRP